MPILSYLITRIVPIERSKFDMTEGITFLYVSFIIVIVCTIWMIHGLKSKSQIRKAAFAKSPTIYIHKQKWQLSKKERKLEKVALALAVTLSVCGLIITSVLCNVLVICRQS